MGRFNAIDAFLSKMTLKKLGLSPLNVAEVFIEHKQYDQAVKYLKQIQEFEYFDYKVEMLKSIEKYSDALEVILSEKNNYHMAEMVKEILDKRPDLRKKAQELNEKYKAGLSL